MMFMVEHKWVGKEDNYMFSKIKRILNNKDNDYKHKDNKNTFSDKPEDYVIDRGLLNFLNTEIPKISYPQLEKVLGFKNKYTCPKDYYEVPLSQWKMQTHDAPILRYIYRNFLPTRHLEFGTWQGEGTVYCLEESNATVWTINLLEGEPGNNYGWAYGEKFETAHSLADSRNTMVFKQENNEDTIYHRTDSFGFIGRFYHEKNYGKRVCQIFSDSCEWDISNYPIGFFDTCLIDGGHTKKVVISDTQKAIKLVRSKGLVIWHDFCPNMEVLANCSSPRGVCEAIKELYPQLKESFSKLFWIYPSWILVGIRK